MKKLLSNSFFQQAVTLLLSVIFIVIGAIICKYEPLQTTDAEFQRAVVNEVIATTEGPGFHDATVKTVVFNATILTGEEKGKSFNMTQLLDENSPPVPEIVEKGDRILVIYNEPEEENSLSLQSPEAALAEEMAKGAETPRDAMERLLARDDCPFKKNDLKAAAIHLKQMFSAE